MASSILVINKLALKFAVRKRAPKKIPMSGDASRNNDFHSVYLIYENDKWGLLVEDISKEGIVGKSFDGKKYENLCCIRWDNIGQVEYIFRHYFKGFEFVEKSPLKFLLSKLLFTYKFFVAKDKLEQFIFNRKTLVRHQRIDILRNIVEQYLGSKDTNIKFHPILYLKTIYGDHWIFHPEKDRILKYYTLMFNSLTKSGELNKNEGTSYTINAAALNTMAAFEEEEQKHRDAIGQQKKIIWLTLALVCVGSVHAYINYIGEC
ncbi:hypothetical protein C8R27_11824 [Nitrosomonas ureae]|uniref:hypothetical protein n=1 Tax=Nitrosomonas ureae TaxID=44577 RepID=UPI000D772B4B|nr:hypothetical protein [Nitrosomonas ureae]PXX13955.1 hypothetical protein C8R27_11824 [Nitrosomonas ureae]